MGASSKKWMIILLISLSVAVVLLAIILTVFAALVIPVLKREKEIGPPATLKTKERRPQNLEEETNCQAPRDWRDTTCCPVRSCAKKYCNMCLKVLRVVYWNPDPLCVSIFDCKRE